MRPVNVKSSTYINFSNNNNEKDPKFETGDIVRISKYKNIFAKDLKFCDKKVKNTVPWI